jgi:hypothetical protein
MNRTWEGKPVNLENILEALEDSYYALPSSLGCGSFDLTTDIADSNGNYKDEGQPTVRILLGHHHSFIRRPRYRTVAQETIRGASKIFKKLNKKRDYEK